MPGICTGWLMSAGPAWSTPACPQSELALVLGLHRSTVCRIIRTLRDRGVLGHFTRCSLEILDREALAELCNPSEGGK